METCQSALNFRTLNEEQKILEILCINQSERIRVDLPADYLSFKEWRTFYCIQRNRVRELLKTYHPALIIKTINIYKISSLFPRWVKFRLDEENNKELDRTNQLIRLSNLAETLSNEISLIRESRGHLNKDMNLDYLDN